MLESTQGNILDADVDALVNTVNCVGVMGKGIALQFKQAFPANYGAYRAACDAGLVQPGRMFVFATGSLVNPRYIINFPTKRHWRENSRVEDIESGLEALANEVRRLQLHSVAIPPLGAGHGGLAWTRVRPLIIRAFDALPNVRVLLYEPIGAPKATDRPIRTAKPELTRARALYLLVMDRYAALDYRRTLLEIQKLAYFLQHAGEPLRLRFVEGPYGPYADNLSKVLERLEGHYTQGFEGDRKPDTEIGLLPNAVSSAEAALANEPDALDLLERVTSLIEGFETPYGMELLATVHWTATNGSNPARTEEEALQRVQAWSERKRRLMRPEHIRVAWSRLLERGWLRTAAHGSG